MDPAEMILSFFDPLQKTSRVYFTKMQEVDQTQMMNQEESEGHNIRDSLASFDSGGIDQQEVIQLVKTYPRPITLEKSVLITVVLEYERNKFVLGLDEPGYLFIERPDMSFVSNTLQ